MLVLGACRAFLYRHHVPSLAPSTGTVNQRRRLPRNNARHYLTTDAPLSGLARVLRCTTTDLVIRSKQALCHHQIAASAGTLPTLPRTAPPPHAARRPRWTVWGSYRPNKTCPLARWTCPTPAVTLYGIHGVKRGRHPAGEAVQSALSTASDALSRPTETPLASPTLRGERASTVAHLPDRTPSGCRRLDGWTPDHGPVQRIRQQGASHAAAGHLQKNVFSRGAARSGAYTSPASLGASRMDGPDFDRVQTLPCTGGGPTTCIDEH